MTLIISAFSQVNEKLSEALTFCLIAAKMFIGGLMSTSICKCKELSNLLIPFASPYLCSFPYVQIFIFIFEPIVLHFLFSICIENIVFLLHFKLKEKLFQKNCFKQNYEQNCNMSLYF